MHYYRSIHGFVFLDMEVYLFWPFKDAPPAHTSNGHNTTGLKETPPINTSSASI